jgi:hypothetical protein
MENETTQTAETALQTQAATTTETTQTQIEAAPSTVERPAYIPEKFWDAQKGEPKVDQLGASYLQLEKAFGAKSTAPKKPGADAAPEQQAQYFAELRKLTGAPEKPEDYGLKAPENLPAGVEWNAELAGKAAGIAHKYGVPPEALHELIALNNETVSGMVARSNEAVKTAHKEQFVDALTKEWGNDSVSNWQAIDRGTTAAGVDKTAFDPGADLAMVQRELAKVVLQRDRDFSDDKGLISSDSASTYKEQMTKIQGSDDFQGKNGVEKQQAALMRLKNLFDASQPK